jgi:hypothetical protein
MFLVATHSRIVRGLLAVLATAFMAACSPHEDAAQLLRDTPLPPGTARLVIAYPSKVAGTDGAMHVDLDGMQSCELPAGNYLVKDVPAGEKTVGMTFCGLPGISYLKLNAVAGQRYYVQVLPYDSSFTGMLSGYPSEYVPKDAPPHKGPFLIEAQDEAVAFEALRSLHRAGAPAGP